MIDFNIFKQFVVSFELDEFSIKSAIAETNFTEFCGDDLIKANIINGRPADLLIEDISKSLKILRR